MGGYGSGRHGTNWPKTAVEQCTVLPSAKLQSDGLIRDGVLGHGSLAWTRTRTGETISTAGYTIDTLPETHPPRIKLTYTIKRTGEQASFPIALTTTPLPWGGVRWWFICPLTVNGRECNRRVGKLYLPPGGNYYGCRHCYDLTYQSTRDCHLIERVAAQLGYPVWAVKQAFGKKCRLPARKESFDW